MEPDSVYLTARADCALTVSEACVAPESDPVCDPLLHLLELADDSDSAGYSTLSTRAVRMLVNEALLAIVATRRDAADTEPHGTNELTADSAPGESADPQSQGDTQ